MTISKHPRIQHRPPRPDTAAPGRPKADPDGELRATLLAQLEYGIHLSTSIHGDLSFAEPKRKRKVA